IPRARARLLHRRRLAQRVEGAGVGSPPPALRRRRAVACDRRRSAAAHDPALPRSVNRPRVTLPGRRAARKTTAGLLVTLTLIALAVVAAHAEWLQPDPTLRDAQYQLRAALRDTIGHADDAGRLDTLGVALLRIGRTQDAVTIFRRVLGLKP